MGRSNEELAVILQEKIDNDILLELWENVKKLGILMANRYAYGKIEHEDLEQIAFISLYDAIKSFDSDRGTFVSIYITCITQDIYKAFERCTGSICLPMKMVQRVNKYRKLCRDFMLKRGVMPTDKQVMLYLGLNEDALANLYRTLRALNISSTNVPASDEDGTEMGDLLPDHVDIEGDVIESIWQKELRQALLEAMEGLSERERRIVLLRYTDGMAYDAIGKAIGLTGKQVAPVNVAALRKLRKNGDKLRTFLPDRAESQAWNSSLGAYRATGSSSTERAALELLKDDEWNRKRAMEKELKAIQERIRMYEQMGAENGTGRISD